MLNIFEHCSRNMVYSDVGARWGIEEPWKSYRDFIDVISFEPDKEEYDKLSRNKMDRDLVLPCALYKEEKLINLHLTKSRGCSSIYEPNHSFLSDFPDVERFNVEETVEVKASTLDKLYIKKELQNMDFIKLDVQGAELDILRGGGELINRNIIGLQVEVEFKEMYKQQPLFAEIDLYIRNKLGFDLFDIRKAYWKYKEGRGIGPSKGQLIFGDALYFRNPFELSSWCSQFEFEEARNKIVMACFMGVLYGYPDYSLCLLGKSEISSYFDTGIIDKMKENIISNVDRKKYTFKGVGKLSGIMHLISEYFKPDHEGWASGERHLGTRNKFGVYYG
jgi:FkbM family methyltransferase